MKPNNEHTSPRVISGSRSQCLRTKWGHSLVCPFISCSTLYQHDENDLTSSSIEFFNFCPQTFQATFTRKSYSKIHTSALPSHHSFREVDLYMLAHRAPNMNLHLGGVLLAPVKMFTVRSGTSKTVRKYFESMEKCGRKLFFFSLLCWVRGELQ